jgi:hypothetical protein
MEIVRRMGLICLIIGLAGCSSVTTSTSSNNKLGAITKTQLGNQASVDSSTTAMHFDTPGIFQSPGYYRSGHMQQPGYYQQQGYY